MHKLEKLGIKVTRHLRYAAGRAAYHTRLSDPDKARGGRVLIYHGVCLTDANRFHPIYIRLRDLETQLSLFKKHFNVLPLADFIEGKWSEDKFNLAITFDDGFANNYHYALPLLEKMGVPATFFVTGIRATGQDILWNDFLALLGKFGPAAFRFRDSDYFKAPFLKYRSARTGKSLSDELRLTGFEEKAEMMAALDKFIPAALKSSAAPWWQQMTPEQIRRAAQSNFVTVGAHGLYHNDLAKIPLQDAMTEMIESRRYLESVTGKTVDSLAFPYGAYTRPLVEQARHAGYRHLSAMDYLFPEDIQDQGLCDRLTINPFIPPVNQLLASISGHYENHPV